MPSRTARRAAEDAALRVGQYQGELRPGDEMTPGILDGIRRADLIIADVSRQNANVFYEIGFAHALRKRRSDRARSETKALAPPRSA